MKRTLTYWLRAKCGQTEESFSCSNLTKSATPPAGQCARARFFGWDIRPILEQHETASVILSPSTHRSSLRLLSCVILLPCDHQRYEPTLTSSRQTNWLSEPDVFEGFLSHRTTRLTLHSSTPAGWSVQRAVGKPRSRNPGMMRRAALPELFHLSDLCEFLQSPGHKSRNEEEEAHSALVAFLIYECCSDAVKHTDRSRILIKTKAAKKKKKSLKGIQYLNVHLIFFHFQYIKGRTSIGIFMKYLYVLSMVCS